MRSASRISNIAFVLAMFVSAGITRPVVACQLCIGFPDKSVTDFIVEADCVVLARPAKDDPFSFTPVVLLKGKPSTAPIDLLVDSVTRRRLIIDKQRRVGLVRDAETGRWRSLGILSEPYESVIRRLVLLSSGWNTKSIQAERTEFFLPLFGHADTQIRELAYLETARAPYRVIRKLGQVTPRQHYEAMLHNQQYIEWRSLAILLLAQSEDPRDKEYVVDSFRSAARHGIKTNLAALAAAAIEVQGAEAIDSIEHSYFANDERDQEQIVAVLRALALHAKEGRTDLQQRIAASYRVLRQQRPDFIDPRFPAR